MVLRVSDFHVPVHEAMRMSLRSPWLAALVLAAIAPAGWTDGLPVKKCKSYVQGRIDVLDAELHKGRKPDEARKLIKRRDKLKIQLTGCERNPNAYQKDI
jgi:hypothetical protein